MASALLPLLVLSACAMGPDYKRPDVPMVTAYHGDAEEGQNIQWKVGQPSDSHPKGTWWEIFNDPTLNGLQEKARTNNQSLQAAIARIDSARATARQSKADFFPQLDGSPSYTRSRDSENTNGGLSPSSRNPSDDFSVPFDLSYEVDLWGRVRRNFEASSNRAKASLSDYENLLLSLQSELAQNYFAYASLQQETGLLERTLKTRQERLEVIHTRVDAGRSSKLDLVRAESDLKTTEAELEGLRERLDLLRNAISILVGEPASTFTLPQASLPAELPVIPVGLPSELLERRPDVAAAERILAARNAEIGVAKASFFPVVKLTGQAGLAADDIGDLFTGGSRMWSYGPSIQIPLFQGGRLMANYDKSKSEYAAAVADYRQQVLVAFRDVEDALDSMDSQQRRYASETAAASAAKEAEDISNLRYDAGNVDYLDLLDAQRTSLDLERTVVRTQGQRFVTTVALIKALGGGWQPM